jgi:hypothetical protein
MKKILYLGIVMLIVSCLVSACQTTGSHPVLANWPKYIPPENIALSLENIHQSDPNSCVIRAVDLIGAWVHATTPEKTPFDFTDANGKNCRGTFDADILPLFTQPNLWYAGAPACRLCHTPDISHSYARLDLSSYQGILAGSSRESSDTKGEDILGGGDWEKSTLYKQLTEGKMPPNRPPTVSPYGPFIHAGIQE